MTVRPATFSDIPSIIRLGKLCLEQSNIKAAVDESHAKSILWSLIGSYEDTAKPMSAAMFVTGPPEDVTGMIVGTLQPMYLVLDELVVTDNLWFVDRQKADAKAGSDLLNRLHQWAETCGQPVRKQHDVNDYLMDLAKADRMMRRSGYTLTGLRYEKEAER